MWMDEGKREHDWNLVCKLEATIINVNKAKNSAATTPLELHPMHQGKQKKLSPKQSVRAIAEAWGIKPPGDDTCPPLPT